MCVCFYNHLPTNTYSYMFVCKFLWECILYIYICVWECFMSQDVSAVKKFKHPTSHLPFTAFSQFYFTIYAHIWYLYLSIYEYVYMYVPIWILLLFSIIFHLFLFAVVGNYFLNEPNIHSYFVLHIVLLLSAATLTSFFFLSFLFASLFKFS